MLLLKATTESLQVTNTLPAVAPTLKGCTYINDTVSTTLLTIAPDDTIAPGDWMIMVFETYDNAGTVTDPAGWTVLQPAATAGTQVTTIYAKNYVDGETSYDVGMTANANASCLTLLWGSGAAPIADWILGTNMLRADIVPTTTFNNVAPSITTTADNTLVLSISTERTTAAENGIASMTGATQWFYGGQSGSVEIETISIGYIEQATAGATSDVTIGYINTQASNGMAIQIGLPPTLGNLDYSVSYTDTASGGATMSSNEGKITGSSTTAILPAPAASTKRLIKLITITNTDPYQNNAVTVQKVISGTAYDVTPTFTLLAGEMVQYMDKVGWTYYSAAGTIKADQFLKNSSSRQLQYNASSTLDTASNPIATYMWTQQVNAGSQAWSAMASSADGNKLAAAAYGGNIYTSTNAGVTWTQQTGSATITWSGLTSSADGNNLAAIAAGADIYTSTNAGVTWTKQTGSGTLSWQGIDSSADGSFVVVGVFPGYIYTSSDFGVTWTQQTGSGSQNWFCVTVSADGSKLAAGAHNGYIYTSSDSGVTWTQQTGSGSRAWVSITSSADGSKIVASVSPGGYVYTSSNFGVTWTQQTKAGAQNWGYLASSTDGNKLIAGVNNGSTGSVYTSSDSGVTWTLQLNSTSAAWNAVAISADGSKLIAGADGGYVYTAIGTLAATPIWTTTNGTITSNPQSNFALSNGWTEQTGSTSQTWSAMAASSDGVKLVATLASGYIYTSIDSGATWTKQTGSGSRSWSSVASSADGVTLAATVNTGSIYLSTDSGVTWTAQSGPGSQAWQSIASSSDGTKFAAVTSGGLVYTYASGTWTQQTGAPSQTWSVVASSADGAHLAIANTSNGFIYTSPDSGVTWTQTSAPSQVWSALASSSDGTHLVAANTGNGFIYTSPDSGVTWTQTSAPSQVWSGLVSSSDGTRLAAANTSNGLIYISTDSGVIWTPTTAPSFVWTALVSSSDGTRLAAANTSNGYVYTATYPIIENNTLALPSNNSLVALNAWTTDPSSAPATNTIAAYARFTANSPTLAILDSTNVPLSLQSSLYQRSYMTWTPGPSNVGTWVGTVGNNVGSGVTSNTLPTTTNAYTAMRRSTFASAATTTNQQMGLRSENLYFTGDSSTKGGFFFSCRFGFDAIAPGCRLFVGFCPSTTIVSADPSASLNTLGFGFDAADTAISFYHNGASGTATKEPISGQGTLATNDTGYDAYIWSPPGSRTVYYRLDQSDTGVTLVDSSVDTNLPVNTTLLMTAVQMSNGTANLTVNSAILGINKLYVETIR